MSEVKRYAVIENNMVVNIIKWDGVVTWDNAVFAVDLTDFPNVKIGDSYLSGQFTPQEEEE